MLKKGTAVVIMSSVFEHKESIETDKCVRFTRAPVAAFCLKLIVHYRAKTILKYHLNLFVCLMEGPGWQFHCIAFVKVIIFGTDVMRQLEADTCNQCLHGWHHSMFPIISEIVCYANVFKERCHPLCYHTLRQYH